MATTDAEETTEFIAQSTLEVVSAITEAWQDFLDQTPGPIDNRTAFVAGFLTGALYADRKAMEARG